MNLRRIGTMHRSNAATGVSSLIPALAGVGLKPQHYSSVLSIRPDVAWFEVHPENYFGLGGLPHRQLEAVRRDYRLSFHGVGLSLGSAGPIDLAHVGQLKRLIARYRPGLVSEHLSWSAVDGIYLSDLLPMPYTEESLRVFIEHVIEVQDRLGQRILVENPSTYLRLVQSTVPEPEFLAAVATGSDCDLLLDVNNVYVSARNHGFDPLEYIGLLPANRIREIHVAGHHVARRPGPELLVDDHGSRISEPVWGLLEYVIRRCGPIPILVEWDNRIPALEVLLSEADRANQILSAAHQQGCQHAAVS